MVERLLEVFWSQQSGGTSIVLLVTAVLDPSKLTLAKAPS